MNKNVSLIFQCVIEGWTTYSREKKKHERKRILKFAKAPTFASSQFRAFASSQLWVQANERADERVAQLLRSDVRHI